VYRRAILLFEIEVGMKKKSLQILIAGVIIATLLAACGPAAATTPTATIAAAGVENPTAVTTALPTGTAATSAGTETATAPSDAAGGEPVSLTVMTHDSFAVSEKVVTAFEQANNIKVNFVKSGDAGAALNRAILTKDAPQADVFYGVDNTFLSRALDAGIYESYASPLLEKIPAEFKTDSQNRALPVDFGDVCINYDKAYFKDKNLAVPQTLQDLTRPEYKGLLVVENPATSSPGLAFMLATIAEFGPDKYLDYWKSLRANGLVVVDGWETAYYTNFSGSTGKGPQPLAVSYASSPVVEVIYASTPLTEAPTGSITGKNTCFRQIEYVGILKGTQKMAAAQKFVDFMLSTSFQEDMPEQMFVYPVNQDAKIPESFQKYSQIPDEPARMDPAEISKNRDAWIQAWDQAVLR
jgi:thiamine transport system substrate-binding protein